MSMQQVNLYLPEFRPRQEWLTFNTLVGASVSFILLMVLVIFTMGDKLAKNEVAIQQLENQLEASKSRINEITKRPRQGNARQLDLRAAQLRRSIAQRERIGQIIEGQNLGNEAGFSEQLSSLAKQSRPTMSLERFRISRGGNFVELKGVTRSAEDVPLYIKRLREETSFATSQFGLISVMEEADNRLHQFSLGFNSVFTVAQEGKK